MLRLSILTTINNRFQNKSTTTRVTGKRMVFRWIQRRVKEGDWCISCVCAGMSRYTHICYLNGQIIDTTPYRDAYKKCGWGGIRFSKSLGGIHPPLNAALNISTHTLLIREYISASYIGSTHFLKWWTAKPLSLPPQNNTKTNKQKKCIS